jgi:hypothetical protein
LKGAPFSYDDVGKVYRLTAISRAGWNWDGEQFHIGFAEVSLVDIRQSTEPKDLNLNAVEKPLALLPGNAGHVFASETSFLLDKRSDFSAKAFTVLRHAGS